jgi:hypothetical protein
MYDGERPRAGWAEILLLSLERLELLFEYLRERGSDLVTPPCSVVPGGLAPSAIESAHAPVAWLRQQ